MTDIDAVAEAIWDAMYDRADGTIRGRYLASAQAAIDTLRPTVTTVEQLDALPDGTILRDDGGLPWLKDGLSNRAEPWWIAGNDCECPATEVRLPAVVLWRPDQQAVD